MEVPVFLDAPTGPHAAVVRVPDGERNGRGVVFVSGTHIPRGNRNGMWTRAAQHLAERGLATIVVEPPGTGDSPGLPVRVPLSKARGDAAVAAARLLVDEVGVSEVAVAGTCFGARVAMLAAPEIPEATDVLFVAAPTFRIGRRSLPERVLRKAIRRLHLRRKPSAPQLAPMFVEPFLRFAGRGRVRFVYGSRDKYLDQARTTVELLRPQLGDEGYERCSFNVIEGHEIHAFRSLEAQDRVVEVTVDWALSPQPARTPGS